MHDSHPRETKEVINQLNSLGVEVIFSNNRTMAYQPAPVPGNPGRISIDKNASFSALLHEKTHAMDDYDNGWIGAKILWDKQKHWDFELDAYNAELEFYKLNKVPKEFIIRLEELKKLEYLRIFGGE